VEQARAQVARWLHAEPGEVVFTSGGTESDNLAIFGIVRRNGGAAGKHVITTTIEHPAVLGACAQLEREGARVTRVRVGSAGVVEAEDVRQAVRPETALITVMHANNETGAVQPIEAIAEIAHEAGVPLHSDGVQAAGRLAVDVWAMGVDLYSLSGHKLNAPKGVGVLAVRNGVSLEAVQHGGRHERERRAGTENVPGIAALGSAAGWLVEHRAEEARRLGFLRDRLETGIIENVPGTRVNAASAPRTPNTTNVLFAGVAGEALTIALDLAGFQVSTGAACSSGAVEPSHVLTAMGLDASEARSSIRFSLGRTSDEAQVDALIEAVRSAVARLRRTARVHEHA
jgi:cysteine desulfurase